jgi:hypothetical protein
MARGWNLGHSVVIERRSTPQYLRLVNGVALLGKFESEFAGRFSCLFRGREALPEGLLLAHGVSIDDPSRSGPDDYATARAEHVRAGDRLI